MSDSLGGLKAKTRGFFLLCRFELPFAAGMSVVIGELLALGQCPTVVQIVLGFLSVFFISAATLALNDYFDVRSDRVNMPNRPLPAGIVTGREVVGFSVALTVLGLVTGYMISVSALLVALIVWGVGFLYNWRLKRTGFLGNLMVSFCVGMTFVFGGLTVGLPFDRLVWFFAVTAALIDLGEEVAGDALDTQGDRQIGSRSLALVWGQENALKISGLLFLSVVALSSLPFWLGWTGWGYVLPIAIMDMGILYSTVRLLDARKAAARRIYIRWIYLSATAGMLCFLFIRMIE
jgi:geranylgeranylglycerol-phosphate geranylgeranyltransferase